jgi:hypothetical protein
MRRNMSTTSTQAAENIRSGYGRPGGNEVEQCAVFLLSQRSFPLLAHHAAHAEVGEAKVRFPADGVGMIQAECAGGEHTTAIRAGAVCLHESDQLGEGKVNGLEQGPGAPDMIAAHRPATPADHRGIIDGDQG